MPPLVQARVSRDGVAIHALTSLLRVKSLQDEVKHQADELRGWNAKLEERVIGQADAVGALVERVALLKAGVKVIDLDVAERVCAEAAEGEVINIANIISAQVALSPPAHVACCHRAV